MAYPNGKKTYADLTVSEQWIWHTSIYASRHMRLDAPIAPGSPHDPDGEWFDQGMVEKEVRKLQNEEEDKRDRRTAKDIELERGGHDIVNKWAQARGFLDIDDYCERNNMPWVDVYTQIAYEICTEAMHKRGHIFSGRLGPHTDNPQEAAIRARKNRGLPEFNPTPQEMAASRRQLGIPEP